MNVIRVYNSNTTASFMKLFMPIIEDHIGKAVEKFTKQEKMEIAPSLTSHNQEN